MPGDFQNPSTVALGRRFYFHADLTTTNGAYTIGDVVGGLITVPNAAISPGRGIYLDNITLSGQTAAIAYELWCLNADLATANVADNGVFTLAAADAPKMLGVVPISTIDQYQGQNAIFCADVRGVGKVLVCGQASTSLYFYIKATATTSPGVTSMSLNLMGSYLG